MNYCARHPKVQSNLRCGKCGVLVCPRCLVHSPVGVRCRECAQLRRLPTFDVSGLYLLRAVGVGLALAVAGGLAIAFLSPLLYRVRFLDLIAFVAAGYLVGGGISLAVNRKRGRSLKFAAGGAMLVAYAIVTFFAPFPFGLFHLAAVGVAFYVAIARF